MDAFTPHDHRQCVRHSVAALKAYCQRKNLKLTRSRQSVFALLLREHKALGAYDLLDLLRAEHISAQPPTAYRALEFLVAHGFVHRIEKLNAFIACAHIGSAHVNTSHRPSFLICRHCHRAAESIAPPLHKALHTDAHSHHFVIEESIIEALGICARCRCA